MLTRILSLHPKHTYHSRSMADFMGVDTNNSQAACHNPDPTSTENPAQLSFTRMHTCFFVGNNTSRNNVLFPQRFALPPSPACTCLWFYPLPSTWSFSSPGVFLSSPTHSQALRARVSVCGAAIQQRRGTLNTHKKSHSSSHSAPLIFQTNTRNMEFLQSANTPCSLDSPFQCCWASCTDGYWSQSWGEGIRRGVPTLGNRS